MCGEFSAFSLLPGEGRLCVSPAQQSEGECNLPCSLGRWSARFPTLERGKPRLSALKRWGRGDCAFCLPNRVGEILHFSLSSGERRFAFSMKKIARVGEISRFRRFEGKGGYSLLPPCPPRHPCPGDFPRPPRLQTPVLSFTIFAEMTLGGSTHLIHFRRIGHSDPPET
ncbi:hypothetical protein T4B_6177 [Trichinella pseudospiralis]|uniref:Uncharacterized protein n=1 Tax=Trichinella pseudospiralis TaxID=6337 RepID=A0A0V1GPW4_TRIPS|nr:hypothetical protein T4B_6177 [Trichinella pseudospiralis]